jgi:hypothetical protein
VRGYGMERSRHGEESMVAKEREAAPDSGADRRLSVPPSPTACRAAPPAVAVIWCREKRRKAGGGYES